MLKYTIIVEKTDSNYSAYCPDLPGCVATGKTVEETIKNMRKAIKFHLEGLKAENMPIPQTKTMAFQIEVGL
ncbi:MAG: type II toxin-antitoxin system HicB family antitoxin [Candidatus Desulfofervidaceae bacterium]|nr:type II toxin-antitoxin system HicB family antitoxin [Candidatus Desulfofervidaceae bacterium]